ncbi:MAG: hypothetical protein ACNY01_02465 [Desulfobacteria bacterium]
MANSQGGIATPYPSSMRSPVKQVKGVVWHLSNHLKNKKAKPWIQGIVLFTNPEVLLSISGETSVPVFQSTDILDYIVNFNTKRSQPRIVEKSKNELMRLTNRSVFLCRPCGFGDYRRVLYLLQYHIVLMT